MNYRQVTLDNHGGQWTAHGFSDFSGPRQGVFTGAGYLPAEAPLALDIRQVNAALREERHAHPEYPGYRFYNVVSRLGTLAGVGATMPLLVMGQQRLQEGTTTVEKIWGGTMIAAGFIALGVAGAFEAARRGWDRRIAQDLIDDQGWGGLITIKPQRKTQGCL